jgi:hypothetical protein
MTAIFLMLALTVPVPGILPLTMSPEFQRRSLSMPRYRLRLKVAELSKPDFYSLEVEIFVSPRLLKELVRLLMSESEKPKCAREYPPKTSTFGNSCVVSCAATAAQVSRIRATAANAFFKIILLVARTALVRVDGKSDAFL